MFEYRVQKESKNQKYWGEGPIECVFTTDTHTHPPYWQYIEFCCSPLTKQSGGNLPPNITEATTLRQNCDHHAQNGSKCALNKQDSRSYAEI